MKKFLFYVLGLVLIFSTLELVVSTNEKSFYSLSDKLLLKLEMLERRNKDEIVFLGSSRTLDAIDAPTFERSLSRLVGRGISAFNAATTGQTLDRYLYNLEEILKSNKLKVVILESSYINFKDKGLGFRLGKDNKITQEKKIQKNETVEGTLQDYVLDHLAFARQRKALKPKVFLRLFMLWTSRSINHDLWFRSNTLKQLMEGFDKDFSDDDFDKYKPLVLKNNTNSLKVSSVKNQHFKSILSLLGKYRKRAIFYNPPLNAEDSKKDCAESRHKLYKIVTSTIDTSFLDYSCGGFPKNLLRDPTHLNPDGRIFFSKMLARDFSKVLEEYPDAL